MGTRILVVDDDNNSNKILSRILMREGDVRCASNGAEALRLARESAPDLVLLDAEMPGMSGYEVCEAMKADETLAEVPVIFVTSHCGDAFEVAGFQIGAADFITKPVNAQLVLARAKAQLRFKLMADELRRLSTIDALTGVANRRRFDEALAREWLRARRTGEPLALLMVDVDHFKLFNDCYGHVAGDACLRSIAQALAGCLHRPADLVARFGGEEFTLLLPQTTRDGAEQIAHRVLDAVAALGICHGSSSTTGWVTASIGIGIHDGASTERDGKSDPPRCADEQRARHVASDLVDAADKALYAAKHAGRATVRVLDVAEAITPDLVRCFDVNVHDVALESGALAGAG